MEKTMQWVLYHFWGKFHNEMDNACLNCSKPAYRRWDHDYSGWVGFCTTCDIDWRES